MLCVWLRSLGTFRDPRVTQQASVLPLWLDQFTRPFTCGWAFGRLQPLAAAPRVSVSVCVSCVISVSSHLLGMYPEAEQLGTCWFCA